MQNPKISIVIPTCNEKSSGYVAKIAREYPKRNDAQFIVVDWGSSPDILALFDRSHFEVLSVEAQTRAERLNIGIERAQADFILCHHPRSFLEFGAIEHLIENKSQLLWGGFTHVFDHKHPGLLFTSWWSNNIRPRTTNVLYLDHCIFFRRKLLTSPIPNIPIFEDTELSYILAESGGPPKILPFSSTTSAIRFLKNGFLRQALLNQKLKWDFHRGRSS
ncbi:MAG: glycosyl transferase, family 2, partial [Pseudomonadota bacterium]